MGRKKKEILNIETVEKKAAREVPTLMYEEILNKFGYVDYKIDISMHTPETLANIPKILIPNGRLETVRISFNNNTHSITLSSQKEGFIGHNESVEFLTILLTSIQKSGPIKGRDFGERLLSWFVERYDVKFSSLAPDGITADYLTRDYSVKFAATKVLSSNSTVIDYCSFNLRYPFDDKEQNPSEQAKEMLNIVDDYADEEEFAQFCAKLLKRRGYLDVTLPSKNHEPINIYANKDGISFAVCCMLGNSPVQCSTSIKEKIEILDCKSLQTVRIIVTNNYFTETLAKEAKRRRIVLWDRQRLLKMIDEAKLYEQQ